MQLHTLRQQVCSRLIIGIVGRGERFACRAHDSFLADRELPNHVLGRLLAGQASGFQITRLKIGLL